jgi:hypothetical protein
MTKHDDADQEQRPVMLGDAEARCVHLGAPPFGRRSMMCLINRFGY